TCEERVQVSLDLLAAGRDSSLTGLAVEAARKALEMAKVDPAPQVWGGFNNVLVIGADAISRYVDWTDRGSCILFGDAAGAELVQACNIEEDGLFVFDLHSDGSGQRHLNAAIRENESNNPLDSNGSVFGFPPNRSPYSCIQMNGKEVFCFAANKRIIDAVAARLELLSERVISNLANNSNTSAASIPLTLDEAVRSGKVKPGQTIATAGFGAGLTWGSAIVRWG
ncbi:3-oxoacyl-[acyl-carrier-protein] synthase 3 A, chloroplastic, partial [Glycine soja]